MKKLRTITNLELTETDWGKFRANDIKDWDTISFLTQKALGKSVGYFSKFEYDAVLKIASEFGISFSIIEKESK